MATYIEMNLQQRINFKQSMINKAVAFGAFSSELPRIIKRIYQDAYECTGFKPFDSVRTYSTKSRRHYK